jgi:hypothetical protein
MRILPLACLTFFVTALPAAAHQPSVTAERRTSPFDAQVKLCNDETVLNDIKERFATRESRDWKTNLQITSIHHVRSIGFRSNGHDLIPRRFCSARATLSNGKAHALTFNISEDGGFSGWHGSYFWGYWKFPTASSYHLEWCISGLDRHNTYAPGCAAARP